MLSAKVLSLRVEGLAQAPHWLPVRGQAEGPGPWASAWSPPRQPTFPSQGREPKTERLHGDSGTGEGLFCGVLAMDADVVTERGDL